MSEFPALEVVVHADGVEVAFPEVPWAGGEFESGGFRLTARPGEVLAIEITHAGSGEFELDHVTYRFSQVLRNFSRVIVPDCGRFYPALKHGLSSWENAKGFPVTANNWGHPFAAFVDQADRCALAVGVVGEPVETLYRNEAPGQAEKRDTLVVYKHRLVVRFERPALGVRGGKVDCWRDAVFAEIDSPSWFHSLRAYADAGRRYLGLGDYPANEAALDPVWCSWTAWNSDDLTADLILRNAKLAKQVGIRGMLIDDGWFGPGLDTDLDWVANGDYEPDPEKIPDMNALVGGLREMGMRSILWMGPVTVSPDSRAFSNVRHLLQCRGGKPHVHPANGMHCLCPSNPEARKYIVDMMVDLLRRFDVDGFKVDLYNNLSPLPCDADHEHDCRPNIAGLDSLMREIWEAVRAEKSDVLMELKQNYGNFHAARYGTMVRAGDSPYDTDINLERALYGAAYAPVTHNDYAVWTSREEPRDLGIMLIKQMTGGVPTFSVDLSDMPETHRGVMRGYLGIYHRWKGLWMGPRLLPQTGVLDVWERKGDGRAWYALLYGAREVSVAPESEIWLCNGTGRENILVMPDKPFEAAVAAYNPLHEEIHRETITFDGLTVLEVPSGGYAFIKTR